MDDKEIDEENFEEDIENIVRQKELEEDIDTIIRKKLEEESKSQEQEKVGKAIGELKDLEKKSLSSRLDKILSEVRESESADELYAAEREFASLETEVTERGDTLLLEKIKELGKKLKKIERKKLSKWEKEKEKEVKKLIRESNRAGTLTTTFKLTGWEIKRYLPGLIKKKNGKLYVRSEGKDVPFRENETYYIKGHGLTKLLKDFASKNKRAKMTAKQKQLALFLIRAASYLPPQLVKDLSDSYEAMVALKNKFGTSFLKKAGQYVSNVENVLGMRVSPTSHIGNAGQFVSVLSKENTPNKMGLPRLLGVPTPPSLQQPRVGPSLLSPRPIGNAGIELVRIPKSPTTTRRADVRLPSLKPSIRRMRFTPTISATSLIAGSLGIGRRNVKRKNTKRKKTKSKKMSELLFGGFRRL